MNFFKGLNKEQWTAVVAVSLSSLLLLFGFSGGIAPAADSLKGGAEEPYNAVKARYVELPDEKFDRYWSKNPFRIESAVKLSVPVLNAPEPREEEMPAPVFRPHPAWELYNRLASPVKYPTLSIGAPLVAEANLPTAAELADLLKLPEPEAPVRPDRRAERERELAQVKLRNGNAFPAAKVEEAGDFYIVTRQQKGPAQRILRADVSEVLQNRTNEDQYRFESGGMKPGPKEGDERFKLAQRCIDLGMIPEAREELKKALELRKDFLDAILLQGQLAVDSSDFESAIATYRAGLDANAPAGELWYEIGRCLRTLSFAEGALVAFEKSVEAQPRLHRAKLAHARAMLDAGQPQAAADAAGDFFTKLGNSPDTTAAHRAEASLVRGLALVRLGQLEKARADFADCLKVDANNSEALNGNGAALALLGQFPQAGPEFAKAIRANQYQIEAWTNLAALYLLGGKWVEADQLSAAAAQRDPASVEAFLARGLAQLGAGNKDAPKQMETAAKIDPGNLQVLMVTGLLHLREGQDEAGLEKFVGALRKEFYYLPAYSGAAAAYLRTGRKLASARDEASAKKADEMRVNAETLLRTIRDFDPARPGAWSALGCAYAVMQRPEDARNALRQASTLSQKGADPLIFYTLGYLEYYYGQAPDAAGRLALARSQFDQAVKLETPTIDSFGKRVIDECKSAIDKIDAWNSTSLRLQEEFNGPDAKQIGSNWLERENQGISISRENSKDRGGRCRFAGKQAVQDWALTSLMHEIPGLNFYSLEMTFQPEKMDRGEYGLSIFYNQQGNLHSGFSVGIDGTGKVRYHTNSSDGDLHIHDTAIGWTDIKAALPNPKEVTIRITLAEQKNRARALQVFFWDPAKTDWTAVSPLITVNPPRSTWQIGAWTHTVTGHEILLYVDNIKVLDQVKQ
ncbi:MAG TPA: tetratricopeptide repeat protein [Planctomycetota bacterium]|nr:tetratricopeptide repeat protein [Planctomycetota bacterium]